jgi:hypothetical protein
VAAATEGHRDIELAVSQLRFGELAGALRRGDVDLAISRVLLEETELIEVTLNREPSVLAVPEALRPRCSTVRRPRPATWAPPTARSTRHATVRV